MGKKRFFGFFVSVSVLSLFLAPQEGDASTAASTSQVSALAGTEVRISARQGDTWFDARTKEIDKDGFLVVKNVLSGWGKIELANKEDAALAGETFTSKMQLLDNKGRRINEKTPVEIYADIAGKKTFIAEMKTDEKGWLTVPHSMIGIKSYIKVKGDGDSLSKDKKRPRIKVESKMEDGRWFDAFQDKLDSKGYLTIRNAVSGKTKFNYVSGDEIKVTGAELIDRLNQSGHLSDKLAEKFKLSDFAGKSFEKPFNLKVKVLDDKGNDIKKKTKVKMTVYLKDRTLKGTMETDEDGWLTIKGAPTNVKLKMEVKD